MTFSTNTEQQINECISLMKNVLDEDLLAIYLYGSSIVGGLQKYSDIDLLVISDRPTTSEEKARVASKMLDISGIYGMDKVRRSIELTVVVKSDINPWKYPPIFDFQYGDWMREDFTAGKFELWETKEMPDLAILITQVLLASKTLFGQAPIELLDPVPYHDFIMATVNELDSLMTDIESDTRNVLLTLARVWSTVETDTISSKSAAASWVIDKLSEEYKPVMQQARAILLGEKEEDWEDVKFLIKPCADFLLGKIKKQISLIALSNHSNKSIRLSTGGQV